MRARFALLLLIAGQLLAGCDYNNGLIDQTFSTKVEAFSFSPPTGPAQGGVWVTLIGKNLQSGVDVFFGDQRSPLVQVTSESSLAALLPPGQLGPVQVRVQVARSGESLVMKEPFRYRAGTIHFSFAADLGISAYGTEYGVGDVNGDGRADIVIAEDRNGQRGGLTLYLGSATGFEEKPTFTDYPIPGLLNFADNGCESTWPLKYSLLVKDLDGDGLSDVALSSCRARKLLFFRGSREAGLEAWTSIVEAGASSGETGRVIEVTGLLDGAQNRYLIPLDLDGDGRLDLLVINHRGDASLWPQAPEQIGTIAYLLRPGDVQPKAGALSGLSCPRMHSSWTARKGGHDALLLLCAQGELAGKSDLHLLTLELVDAALQVTADTVAATGIGSTQRFHMLDLDGDGQLEVLAVDGGSAGSSDGQLSVDWGSVDLAKQLQMKHDSRPIGQGPAVLLHANVTGDKAEEVIVGVASHGTRYLAVLTPASDATWSVPAGLRPADFANCGPGGTPMMPTLGAGDVDGDGLAELLVPDPWGATQLLHHVERWDSLVSSAPWKELGKAATRSDGTTLPHEPHPWTPLLDGIPAGQLVDLDGDGEKDLLDFFGDGATDLVISELSPAGGQGGGLQRVSWSHDRCGGGGTGHHGRPLLRDWNADGMADILLPVVCPDGLHLESLVSKGGHYEHGGSLTLSTARSSEVLTWLPGSQPGKDQLVVADRQPSCGTYCYTIRRFEGNPLAGFHELSPLVEKVSLLYPVLLMIDLNDDGALDLLGPGEDLCFGGDYHVCENRSSGEDGSSWHSNNGIFRDEVAGELALITFKPTEVAWGSYSHGITRKETTSLDLPGGRLLKPRARAACDIDGDGRQEILIVSGQQGREGAVVSGLFKDPASGKLALQTLGSIAGYQATTDIACTRSLATPGAPAVLPDLVLYQEWLATYYRIRNESR